MSMNDTLSMALSSILSDEKLGRSETSFKPSSKIIKKVLEVMHANNYIGKFEETDDGRGNSIKVNLLGRINRCGVIKPRYSLKKDQFEKFEERFLLAKDMGILIVSTPSGIMTHIDAKKKDTGGKLLAFCY